MWHSRKAELECQGNKIILRHGAMEKELDAGCSDDIDVYEDREHIFVLSENPRYGYAGIQVFNKKTGQEVCSQFLQDLSEELPTGRKWNEDWAPWTKIRELIQLCEELADRGI